MSYIYQVINALFYSLCGFKAALKEKAFQLELVASLIIIPTAFLVDKSAAEKALLVLSWFVVLIAELINTAIEKTIDRISIDIHPLSKQVKDMASCAVLFSIVAFAIVWMLIL